MNLTPSDSRLMTRPWMMQYPCNVSKQPIRQRCIRASAASKVKGDCIVLMEGRQKAECLVVHSYDKGCSLQDYMTDAARHFSSIALPLGGKISTVDSETIELIVPRISLFDVWLQPRAQCKLAGEPSAQHLPLI